jgi:hypothetical protein
MRGGCDFNSVRFLVSLLTSANKRQTTVTINMRFWTYVQILLRFRRSDALECMEVFLVTPIHIFLDAIARNKTGGL